MALPDTQSIILLSTFLWLLCSSSVQARIEPRESNTCAGRQSPGTICETCELLSTCVRHSSGWVNIPVETCDTQNGFYCNSLLGMCSNTTGPCHPFAVDGNFPCTSHGVFPDPYDCQKYHMCYLAGATLVSVTVECAGTKAFDAATGQCSLALGDVTCMNRQFQCLSAGEAHAWPTNPNIFYICKAFSNQDERVLYPTLYRCSDGEVFDGYFCRQGIISTEAPLSRPITNSTDNGNGTSNSIPTTSMESKCTEVGLNADLEDCSSYYYCSAVNGNKRHHKCPSGTHFSATIASCVFGACQN
ncbi:uncharacterized protein [Eurosta solidaginis]|uniref:uncharacterized protein n=1 Tax=Eurosta solidaginis TaxID=178769 RepID=UPI00353091CD